MASRDDLFVCVVLPCGGMGNSALEGVALAYTAHADNFRGAVFEVSDTPHNIRDGRLLSGAVLGCWRRRLSVAVGGIQKFKS